MNTNTDKHTSTISRKLVRKYDRPGPRYTSYPTVPEWTKDFTPADYLAALRRAGKSSDPLSLYIHIPFCKKRCHFCGCTTFINHAEDAPERYLETIAAELALVGRELGQRNTLAQLHWGGGTPTYLNLKQLRKLYTSIAEHFTFQDGAEIAIEVDPRVTTFAQLEMLASVGFNRLSMGVQDFDTQVQTAIGRGQTREQTVALIEGWRKLGLGGINIDLVYGLPFQRPEQFGQTVDQVIELDADRVAVYSYAHLPDFRPNQVNIDQSALPDAEAKFELFVTAVERFLAAGYVQIGMDHFAKPDEELARSQRNGRLFRNFMGYTSKLTSDMIGVGLSAIGDLAGCFTQNDSTFDGYLAAIDQGKPATFRGLRLTEDDKVRRWTIMNIMCNFQLDFARFHETFGVNYHEYYAAEDAELAGFIADGLLEHTATGLRVLPPGWILVRNIAMVFDPYLRRKRDGKAPQFSRTI